MSEDPLRFLNIKKKREQNQKNIKMSKISEHKSKNMDDNKLSAFPSFSSLNDLQIPQKVFYNPAKYFSQKVEEYLNQKVSKKNHMKYQKERQDCFEEVKNQKNQEKRNFSKKKTKTENSDVLFEKQTMKQNVQKNQNQAEPITPIKVAGQDHFIDDQEIFAQNLKECEICGRKFNYKSYQKHVKVCQKVFFKKRKPFISRSTITSTKG